MASKAILRAARARIADPLHWTQGTLARDERGRSAYALGQTAVCWCALGALRAERSDMNGPETRALEIAAQVAFGRPVAVVNDYLGHAAVLKMYDAAIALVWGDA